MVKVVIQPDGAPALPVGAPSTSELVVVPARRPTIGGRPAARGGAAGPGSEGAGGDAHAAVGIRGADPPAATVAAQVLFAFADPCGVEGDTFTTVMIDLICHSDPPRRDLLRGAFPLYVRAVELAVSGAEGIDRLHRVAAGPNHNRDVRREPRRSA